jgi:Mg-chelatase subunit ChlD
MRFTTPFALLLLLLIPLLLYLGWPVAGNNRRREIFSLIIRSMLVICLILALAGLELTFPSGKGGALAVVFLVDHSDSMPEAARQVEEDYVRQALQAMRPDDQAAVILFGGEALVEQPMSPSKELEPFTSVPSGSQTNLAKAIQLAMALYPPDKARRMVILSDGAATFGDAEAAARLAASTGVEIIVVPLLPTSEAEVMVSAIHTPSQLRQGDRFNLEMTLEANQPVETGVRIYASGALIFEGSYALKPGSQTFSLPLTAGEPGFTIYEVQLIPEADKAYQNNQLASYTQVSGPPKVLLVAPPADELLGRQGELRGDEASALLSALEAAGTMVEPILPYDLPAELANLAEYASVVLVDVPARQLTSRQMTTLQSYVRDLGGGLVVVGGPTSYGVGGYFRTPLEETLPVEIQIKDEQRRPSLAIVFVIDHSGSMAETSGGVVKLELAKEAAMRSVELLMPSDRVGVIAFDDAATWVVPMTDLENPEEVIRSIGTLRPGGGTDILAGLQAMADLLPGEQTTSKHVILLTDGGANPAGIPELVTRLFQENNITLTTVGVGRDAAPFLPNLAELGGGRYHFAADPGAIPSIFTEETMLATRSYIIEEEFSPQLLRSSPILEGINALPSLFGYVGTSPKDTAQTILGTHKGDPLLASWQYGLGKVVAFTSDATGRWAKDWVKWEDFSNFWSNAVQLTVGDMSASALNTQVQLEEGQATLTVDTAGTLLAGDSALLNGYAMMANIVDPGGQVQVIQLKQVAPGKYEGIFTTQEEGVYLLRLTGEPPADGGSPVGEMSGWVYTYSAEYRELEPDPDALYRISLAGNGRIAPSDPSGAFEHSLRAPGASRPLWAWLVLWVAFLLPVDIGIRRLVITKSDLRQGLQRLVQKLRGLQPAPASPAPRSKQMEKLQRVKMQTDRIAPVEESKALISPKPPTLKRKTEEKTSEIPLPTETQVEQHPIGQDSQDKNQSTAAALLAKKKARK